MENMSGTRPYIPSFFFIPFAWANFIYLLICFFCRLDERKRRKDFILERNLLYPDPFEKDLTQEEKEICRGYRVFMRFHSKEEHEVLLRSVIEEHRILRRIQDLQVGFTA